MRLLTDITVQLKAIWSRWSASQRAIISIALVLSVMSIAGVGYWATRPHYVVLANRLTPAQTADYVSALEAAGISYQLNFAGSAISVPQSVHNQARLEVRDLLEIEAEQELDLSGSLWSDPAMNQARLMRQLEQRIARTIQQMKPIHSATVHLSRPESSPFVREQKPAKASVTIDIKPGASFTSRDSSAIVSLVAHSVEHLTPENVTLLSTDGRVLSSPTGLEGEVSGQLEYRQQLEASLATKAETLLLPLLGVGRSTVRVSAEIDFTETERKQRIIDPDSKAKVKEEVRKVSYVGDSPVPVGPPGTSSNLTPPSSSSKRSGQHESEDLLTEYLNGETTDLIRELPGRVQRLTIAAVVQLPDSMASAQGTTTSGTEGNTAGSPDRAESTVTKEKVEAIIRNAVGFDESRGDQIEVVAASLVAAPDLASPVGFLPVMSDYLPLIRGVSLGLASLVALGLGLLMLRRIRPVVIGSANQNTLSPEILERLNSLSNQIQDNPEAVTTVLASWLSAHEESEAARKRAA